MRHKRHWWPFFVAAVLGTLLAAGAGSAAAQAIATPQELEAFAERYYQRPQPERIGAAIAFLGTTDLLANRSAEHLYFGFFANAFVRHPERAAEWRELIGKQNARTREALLNAMNAPAELRQVIASQAPTLGRNDQCWGAFFATGDLRQVAPVIDALQFTDERRDSVLFMAAALAKWSLSLQARKHPIVHKMLEYVVANSPRPLRDAIVDVIAKDADRIRQEVAAVMRSQHAKGLWLERGASRTPNGRLSFLLGLAGDTVSPDPDATAKAKDALARAMEDVRTTESYCSQYVVKDLALTQLKDHDYSAYGARIDYAAPGRYHVTQQAWLDPPGRYVYDEWISVGDENFQNMGLWFRSEDGLNAAQNQKFSLRELTQRLARIGAADRIDSQTIGTGSYWLLSYGDLQRRSQLADLRLCDPLALGSCDLRLWIDAKSETIAKTQLTLRGTDKDGKNLHIAINQVFGCHGEAITVTPPPRLNAVQAADGKLTITDSNVIAIPHHGGEINWSLDAGAADAKNRGPGLAAAHKPPTGDPLARPPHPYMHYFRTEVQNVSDHPLKIVWFGGFAQNDGKWVGIRLAGSGPLEGRFSSSYTEGERIVDGVIPPGKAAVCDANWTGGSAPDFARQKWAYVATDSAGNAYYAEAVVEPDVIKSVPPATTLK